MFSKLIKLAQKAFRTNYIDTLGRIENHSFVAVQYIQKNCRSADKLLEPGM